MWVAVHNIVELAFAPKGTEGMRCLAAISSARASFTRLRSINAIWIWCASGTQIWNSSSNNRALTCISHQPSSRMLTFCSSRTSPPSVNFNNRKIFDSATWHFTWIQCHLNDMRTHTPSLLALNLPCIMYGALSFHAKLPLVVPLHGNYKYIYLLASVWCVGTIYSGLP